MATVRYMLRLGLPCFGLLLAGGQMAHGADPVPSYLEIIVDRGSPTPAADVAAANVLALDDGMQQIYAGTLAKYTENMRARVPVILARFTEDGGRMTLLPPGEDPIEAAPVPAIYPLVKSVSHSAMAVYQIVAPYLLDPSDGSWRTAARSYLGTIEAAKATLDALDVAPDVRERQRRMLDRNVAFLTKCLETGKFDLAALTEYAHQSEKDVVQNVALAAKTQVDHWEGVLKGWKAKLGDKWDSTYAITNTLYVTRQNNILFTILAQFMGKEAIDDRLILVGTTAFVTTEAKLLDVLTRIVADRAIGKVFFRDPYVMDAELLGGAARHAIDAHAKKDGKKALLPSLAPFDTHQWPWPTEPKSGPGPGDMQQVPGD